MISEHIARLKIHHPDVDLSPAETSLLSSAKQGSVDSSKTLSDIPEAKVSKETKRASVCQMPNR